MFSLRTCSVRRYRIDGRLPSAYDEDFFTRLRDRRFLPLTANEERSYGWVTVDNLLLTRFDVDTVVRGESALIGLRIDRRRVNPRILRAQLDLELEGRRKAATDAGKPFRLSRDERQQLRADLHAQLLRDTNPSVETHTLIVQPKKKLMFALTLSKRANEVLVALFRDTFGVDVSPLTPWRRGGEILAGLPAADALHGLSRTEFGAGLDIELGSPRRDAEMETAR